MGVAEVVPPGARTYVSIDIDVLDLPLIPGCVSAEPNGMTYAELRDTLAAIAGHCDVVGLDLVEVNPTLDVGTGITSYFAAHTRRDATGVKCASAAQYAPNRNGPAPPYRALVSRQFSHRRSIWAATSGVMPLPG